MRANRFGILYLVCAIYFKLYHPQFDKGLALIISFVMAAVADIIDYVDSQFEVKSE